MSVDFSQFCNREIPSLLNDSVALCRQFSLKQIEAPLFFIAVQQRFPAELKAFLNKIGTDEVSFYNGVGALVGSFERVAQPPANLPMSEQMVDILRLTLRIEGMCANSDFQSLATTQQPLIAALLIVRSPLQAMAAGLGITSDMVQGALFSPDNCVRQGDQEQPSSESRQESTQQPAQNCSQRSQADTEVSGCPTLKQFCSNWLERAREGSIEPAIGRDEEIMRVLQILTRKTKNNPVLVGEPGTGKTAVVEGLAFRLLNGDVPMELVDLKLYQLDLGVITSLGNGEEVMRKLVEELKEHNDVVLFIDEIHTLVGSGSGSDNPIANLLKPEMARGTIKILGATTLDEYTKHIEKDKAFERRFQKVTVDEPDIDTAITILKGIKNRFENHHHVNIPDHVVECAVKLSHRYLPDRRLPDKAIDLLDEAASCLRINHTADTLDDKDIMDVVTKWTGIPMQNMTEDDTERLRHIEENLRQSVIGQEKAIVAVANAIRRNRLGLSDASRPIGSFLFLGTTGVGKTELCKALAEYLFRSRDMIVRIDMSEYQQEHSVARLFGAPPGYVGYDQGGQLTEAVRRKPYSLVLFDEIEKAHPKIFETLLQVLDDGRMTDGQGRVVDFKNTIIVMTSNMGQDVIMRSLTGHEPTDELVQHTSEAVIAQLKTRVAPEFINRIDNIVMFLPLTLDDIKKISVLQLDKTVKTLASNGIKLTYTPEVVDFIAEKSYQPEYGGRPVKRSINNYVKDAIGQVLMDGSVNKNMPVVCSVGNDVLKFENVTEQA